MNLSLNAYGIVPLSASTTDMYFPNQAEFMLAGLNDKDLWHFDELSFMDEDGGHYIVCVVSQGKKAEPILVEYDQQTLKNVYFNGL